MYIGLDLGTSSLKALLIGGDQAVLAEAYAPLTVSRPQPGWSEQDPQAWIDAAGQVLKALAAQVPLDQVQGIGLSGHMHGATVLDRDGAVLRPCILWNDTRAAAEAAELDADPRFRAISGNIVFPGFTAPKLLWMQRHEPELAARVAKVLLPKDYLRLWLTGEYVSDLSDAAGTAWLDCGARAWSAPLLEASGLSQAQMPGLVEGSEISGRLRPALAAGFGLTAGIPVAGGGGDNAAAGIGLGVVSPGQAFVSLGTSGVLFAASDGYHPDPATAVHTFCHAVPGRWHQMGVILAATDALNWLGRVMGKSPAALTAGLGALQAPGPEVFLPYPGGERTPLNNARLRAGFMGLGHASEQEDLVRAVLLGVAYALRDCRDALAATGTTIEALIATGGGAKSDYWIKAIATILNVPVSLPAAGDFGAALGAARLGQMAATGAGSEIATQPEIDRVVDPDPSLVSAFEEGYQRWRQARDGLVATDLPG